MRGGLRSVIVDRCAAPASRVARASLAHASVALVIVAIVAILAGACAKRSLSTDGTAGIAGVGGSAGGGPIGGAAGQGGGNGGNGLSGAAGDSTGGDAAAGAGGGGPGGTGALDGGGVDGGGGRVIPLRILATLATTDATIDQVSGADLFDLAKQIGYAQGYAVCVCTVPDGMVWSPDGLDGCAQAESGFHGLVAPMQARCVFDLSRNVPGFDDYLRCRMKAIRDYGQYQAMCVTGMSLIPPPPPRTCTAPESTLELLQGFGCEAAFYCADGTFAMTGHCDAHLDCPDGADERGCGEIVCGDALVDPVGACDPEVCAVPFSPPICAPNDPEQFLCGDGTETSIFNVCNGDNDCANGRDEALCF